MTAQAAPDQSSRKFSRAELTSTITLGQFWAMTAEDQAEFNRQLYDLWARNYSAQCAAENVWDDEAVRDGIIDPDGAR